MRLAILFAAACAAAGVTTFAGAGVPWENVLETKIKGLESAAARAVAQQHRGHFPPQPIEADYTGAGGVGVERSDAWDADGDGSCLEVTLTDIPQNRSQVRIADRLRVRFPRPINVLEKATGFAFWVRTPEDLSPDLRVGVHFKVEGTEEDPIIFSDTPVVQRFGDNPHLVYFDWGYVFDHSVGVFKVPPREFFTKVTGIDLTFVQKRIPYKDLKLEPVSGHFWIDGLRLVDWLDGTYDNSRCPSAEEVNAAYPIVCQGRTQQVALIAARFGGEEGIASAVRAMDMMARIQSWDGSWPEMRTRMQGEFTHGMILADLARALEWLRQEKRPELDEEVTVRHWTMRRGDLYEQMLYRAAMSRTPGPFSEYKDSYCSGYDALRGGCNRPMAYALGQYAAARVMTDAERKREIMAEYDANTDDLVAAQGVTAGGWPIFGEGNRYDGKGLHWDCGYTTDHVCIMVNASRATDDDRWGKMMRKFDTVVRAMMLPNGRQIDGGLSERGHAKRGGVKEADILFQEAVRRDAPMLAQWGANASRYCWENWPRGRTLWPSTRSFRGYALGAFLTWQVYDLQEEPRPRDLGIVFPRQWPVWTARWMNKEGEQVRQSKIIAKPGGQMVNTFEWAVGQYPVLSAVPVAVSAEGDVAVELHPLAYEGDVQALAADGVPVVATGPADGEVGQGKPMEDDRATIQIGEPTRVEITAPGNELKVTFRAVPRGEGSAALTVRLLREPEPYEHLYAQAEAADVSLATAGVNLVDPATGTRVVPVDCYPNKSYGVERACDDNQGTAWVIGQFKPGSALRFEFAREVRLAKLVVSQGDWKDTFNLAREVTVKLSDGTEKRLSLEKSPGHNVELNLGGARSESLALQVDAVYERPENKGNVGGWMELKILTAGE